MVEISDKTFSWLHIISLCSLLCNCISHLSIPFSHRDLGMLPMHLPSPGVGIEPTALAFRTSVLTITPPRIPDVTNLPMPTCVCGSLPEKSVSTIHEFTLAIKRKVVVEVSYKTLSLQMLYIEQLIH